MKMKLTSFTIILTDQCNFDCSYCYQKKGGQILDPDLLTRVIRFFRPFFAPECFIYFYGGEPLLAFAKIEQTVEQIDEISKKRRLKARYSITTNGSLLDDEILDFFEEHKFSVLLSFDGLAQDVSRKKGSFDFLMSVIPKILERKRISLETNSVFTSATIHYLSRSIELLDQLGMRRINVAFGHKLPWTSASLLRQKKEIARVQKYFRSRYQRAADIPWVDLHAQMEKAVYGCTAGLNKMALAADGTLWGCYLFPQYFSGSEKVREARKYCFGNVDRFIKNHCAIYPRKMENYSELRMDNFSTPHGDCEMCDEIEECWICPLAAALVSGKIGRIPAEICAGAKMWRKEKRRLLGQLEKPN
jgi:sulfatase maturation enzyme AslB (radical SAM superfamily)